MTWAFCKLSGEGMHCLLLCWYLPGAYIQTQFKQPAFFFIQASASEL